MNPPPQPGQIDAGRVVIARTARKLSQRALAELALVSQGYLAQIETGARRTVSASALGRLAAALGVKPADLCTPTTTDGPLTVAAAAQALQLHPDTVRTLIHRGEIAASRVGHQYRIPAAEVRRLLTPAERAS